MWKVKPVLVLTALMLLTIPGLLGAEDGILPNGAGTKIEPFLSQKGKLLVKEVFLLGKVSGLYSSSGARSV